VPMTPAELRTAQTSLGLSDDALADELTLTPNVIRSWHAGSVAIPEKESRFLRWRAAIAEREAAVKASGLPVCEWVKEWEAQPLPDESRAFVRRVQTLNAHGATCPVCLARVRYAEDRFGPMPPAPAGTGLVRIFDLLERLPPWARPAATGAALLGVIVGGRALLVLPFISGKPGELLFSGVTAIGAAMAAGAAGGFAYSATRPILRRLGRPGDYLSGIVCVYGYMTALALAAPVAFGGRVIKDRSDLVAFTVISTFFGLVIGHSWFRSDA
jgi:hypothetical protein